MDAQNEIKKLLVATRDLMQSNLQASWCLQSALICAEYDYNYSYIIMVFPSPTSWYTHQFLCTETCSKENNVNI